MRRYLATGCTSAVVGISILCMLLVDSLSLVYAQSLEEVGRRVRSQASEEIDFPEFVEEEAGGVDLVLPEPGPAHESERLSSKPAVLLSGITVQGNTVLTLDEVKALVDPYLGRLVSLDELQDIRQQLSILYFQKGYVNSGVVLPDQKVSDGVVVYRAIEGRLSDVELSGNGRIRERYLTGRIERGVEDPLDLQELQQSLMLLQQNPLIKSIHARLEPGDQLGEGVLKADIKEAKPYTVRVTADNHQSPSVGSDRGIIELEHRNLTGWGDSLLLGATHTSGVDTRYGAYRIPINAQDTAISAYYESGETIVVEEPFDDIDIESETDRGGIFLSHPVINSLQQRWEFSAGLELSKTKTSLLDNPFSFDLGADDGKTNATVISLSSEYVRRSAEQVFALRGTVRRGIDALDATVRDDDDPKFDLLSGAEIPDGEFTSIIGQVQYARKLPFRLSEIRLKGVTQKAFDPLLSIEKFVVGGSSTVRGYRENQFVRDNGVVASVEVHIPLWVDENGVDRGKIKLIPFFDYGRSWDEDDNLSTSKSVTIRSVGSGISWYPATWFDASVYYGYALDDNKVPDYEDDDLQDDGIQYSATLSWPFD